MKGWFNKTSNIKLRLSVFLIVYLLHFLHKKTNTPDHYEVKRTCCRYEVFTFDYINIYEDIQTLITQLTINYYSVSMLEYKNLNSFFQLLLLLSGDINKVPFKVPFIKMQHNVRVNGTFLGTEAYILSTLILIVCY